MIEQTYREYVMNDFCIEHFFEFKGGSDGFLLQETDEGGETLLHFKVNGANTVAIPNCDKKKTLLDFLRTDKALSLNKRVDHIVLEERDNNQWIVHLIEMKSSVSSAEKWTEIKGKFRASYLFVQTLCAMLHMELAEVRMYTTYEKVTLNYKPENLICRRPRVGDKEATPQQEWDGEKFTLRFGVDCRLPFRHTPILVVRNQDEILEGEFQSA